MVQIPNPSGTPNPPRTLLLRKQNTKPPDRNTYQACSLPAIASWTSRSWAPLPMKVKPPSQEPGRARCHGSGGPPREGAGLPHNL